MTRDDRPHLMPLPEISRKLWREQGNGIAAIYRIESRPCEPHATTDGEVTPWFHSMGPLSESEADRGYPAYGKGP